MQSREVHQALCDGYTDVVDADLSKYFDTIPHDQLMRSVARRVSDGKMLRLIKAWLKTPVEETDERGNRRMTGGKGSRMGTPQGGVISPLLANIYMNRFLRVFVERGKDREFAARLVNYADDFVILSRGRAKEALEWTRRVMAAIGLTLNETKTCLRNGRREHFDFLGYTFGPERYRKDGHWYLGAKPSKKAVRRLKEKVRAQLRPGNMEPLAEVVPGTQPPPARVGQLLQPREHLRRLPVDGLARLRTHAQLPPASPQGVHAGHPRLRMGPGVRITRGHLARRASSWPHCRESGVNPVGEPDAGNPHVRFDERGRETGSWAD